MTDRALFHSARFLRYMLCERPRSSRLQLVALHGMEVLGESLHLRSQKFNLFHQLGERFIFAERSDGPTARSAASAYGFIERP
jgi:hypothetical protein